MPDVSVYFITNLLPIFYFFCLVLLIYAAKIFFESWTIFNTWYPKIKLINDQGDLLEEEDLDNFEQEASQNNFISLLINRIKDISRKVRELSVNEINELTDEHIYKFENNLTAVSNAYIIIGVFFTVLGIFTGLVGLEAGFKIDEVAKLIAQLRIGFRTTLYGVGFSVTINLATKFMITPLREKFAYNLILFTKNVLVPKYAVPDAEKDLGIIVQSISKASKELQNASKSVKNMAKNSQVSTEQIQNAVRGFTETTDKMIQREDHLIENINNVSDRLTEIKSSMAEMIMPSIDQLQDNITKRDLSISGHFETLKNIQSKQSQINNDIRDSMDKVSLNLNALTEFFNRDFEGPFREAVESINKRYKHRFDDIFNSIKSIDEKINTRISVDDMAGMANSLREEVISTTSAIEDKLSVMDDKYAIIYDKLLSTVQNLSSMSDNVDLQLTELVQTTDDYKDTIKKISGDIQELNKRIDGFKSSDVEGIKSIEKDLNNISNQLLDLDKKQSFLTDLLKKIKKDSPKDGGVISGIKAFFSNADEKSKSK